MATKKSSTLVREDAHSPYVIARGRTYRPVFPKPYMGFQEDAGAISSGNKVLVSPHLDGPLANVGDEVWFSHGNGWKPQFWEW